MAKNKEEIEAQRDLQMLILNEKFKELQMKLEERKN